MKPLETVHQAIKDEIKRHENALSELEKELEMVEKLPEDIANLQDCEYVDYWSWSNKLYVLFKDNATAKILKMAGVQGLVATPERTYSGTLVWHWKSGELECNDTKFLFGVGEAEKPASCEIEEKDEIPTTPIKVFKIICHETGEAKVL